MQRRPYFPRRLSALLLWTIVFAPLNVAAQTVDESRQSSSTVNETLLPTGEVIQPAGELLPYFGRPIDLALAVPQKLLAIKDRSSVLLMDAASFKLRQTLPLPNGASINGIKVLKNGDILVTDAQNSLHRFASNDAGTYLLSKSIEFAKGSYPCGLCINQAESIAYVAYLNAIRLL
jgi:hypothetical protein